MMGGLGDEAGWTDLVEAETVLVGGVRGFVRR